MILNIHFGKNTINTISAYFSKTKWYALRTALYVDRLSNVLPRNFTTGSKYIKKSLCPFLTLCLLHYQQLKTVS